MDFSLWQSRHFFFDFHWLHRLPLVLFFNGHFISQKLIALLYFYLLIMLHKIWKNKKATSRSSNWKSVCTLIHPLTFMIILSWHYLFPCYNAVKYNFSLHFVIVLIYCHAVQWFNMYSTTSLGHCISSNYAPVILHFMDVAEAQTSLLECINYKKPLYINNCSC